MMTVRPRDIEIVRYPDGQTHVRITKQYADIGRLPVRVVWPIRNNDELVLLMQVCDALDGMRAIKQDLVIPYLMGARSDRRMSTDPTGSFDLKVVARCINACDFREVNLFDVHSDAALQLIDRSWNHDNRRLVAEYKSGGSVLICPDAGAVKKIDSYMAWNPSLTDVVYCAKVRDPASGKIRLKVFEPEKCFGRHCVVIDDICDGGATFLAIAQQVRKNGAGPATLTLMVSHGIFSKGVNVLLDLFDQVITSDSYQAFEGSWTDKFKVVPLNL